MNRFRCGTLVSAAAFLVALLPMAAFAQASPINQFSDSFFTFDVPNGTLTAKVDITIQNASAKDVSGMSLFAMPKAQDLVVKRGEAVLETKLKPLADAKGLPTVVALTFDKPLKTKAKTQLQMTYTVANQKSEIVRMAPGIMELMLTSPARARTRSPGSTYRRTLRTTSTPAACWHRTNRQVCDRQGASAGSAATRC